MTQRGKSSKAWVSTGFELGSDVGGSHQTSNFILGVLFSILGWRLKHTTMNDQLKIKTVVVVFCTTFSLK